MNGADKLNKQLDDLWAKFLPEVRSRIETIQRAIDALHNETLALDIRVAAIKAAHKLAGSLGTFGLENASADALEIEQSLTDEPCASSNPALLIQRLTRIRQAIDDRGRIASSTARA